MDNLIISLESTCDLSKEMVQKYGLKIIDMNFMIGDQTYSTKDDTVVTSNLYTRMKAGEKTSTSQINESLYEEFFNELLKEGKPILHLAFSSGLSNTCISAKKVAEKLNSKNENKIYVIDTLCACSGHGLIAMMASDYAKQAKDINEVVYYVENIKMKLHHNFSVDNLKYLANGGRIKSSSAFVGNLLQIKPIMKMDNEGKLCVVNKVISRRKSLSALAKLFVEDYDPSFKYCLISHANCLDDANIISKKIQESTGVIPLIQDLGPVIGCHSGPGTISVYYISKILR